MTERAGLQLGVHLGQQNAPMADMVELWKRFDDVWDHLYEAPPNGGKTPHFEAVATLGALASVTSKARIGCLMFCAPFRNPAVLAKSCVAIDHISGGRFEPGFGAGWHEPEFRAHGYEFPSTGVRFDMLTDAFEIITGMLGPDATTTHQGTHFSVDDVTCVPGPLNGSMPLWAGGRGPKRTPAIAARYCSTLERSINLAFHMGADRASSDAELQRIIDQWGPETAERITGGALTGLADDVLERIGAYREAGADLINVALRLPVDDDALEIFLTDVVPQARAAWRN